MKLASVADGSRDGALAVLSTDLRRAVVVREGPATFQAAMDDWTASRPRLQDIARRLNEGTHGQAVPADGLGLMAPLPRAYQWIDGSAYVNHVELVRRARGAAMPASYWTDPLVYQGGSDDMLAATADAAFASEDWGIDLEAEVAVIIGDVPMGSTAEEIRVRGDIRCVMLVNDWSLRNIIPGELAKGFGFLQSKPSTAFSPVAVTLDELAGHWDGDRLNIAVRVEVNGALLGAPDAGRDMTFGFPELIAHCAKTRNLRAGSIIGSGTVSNSDRSAGSACIAEVRSLEQLETGRPITPFLRYGDRVRIEAIGVDAVSVFGAIEQRVVPATTAVS